MLRPTVKHYGELKKLCRRGGGRIVGARGVKVSQENGSQNQLTWTHREFTETEPTTWEPTLPNLGILNKYYGCKTPCFIGTPNSRRGECL